MDNQFLDDDHSTPVLDSEKLEYATQGTRFGTFVIDRIISFGFSMVLAVIYFAMHPEAAARFDEAATSSKVLDYVFGYISLILYYAFFEIVFKGRTVGKMLCGTRAVTVEGEIMSAGTVLARTFCRIVPFDAFSFLGALGAGWHDRWSNTMVVTESSYKDAYR
jgi:uncharacterized RDD family membrane protein YckC